MALKLGIQTYQILTNDDEVCIPSLSSKYTLSCILLILILKSSALTFSVKIILIRKIRNKPINLIFFLRLFRKRDEILKQSFSMQKVPTVGLDAIIIGSGIGGLSTAAIMAKSGKKVSIFQKVSFFFRHFIKKFDRFFYLQRTTVM